jgi:transcriptional regulator with XRE-family HTH domain
MMNPQETNGPRVRLSDERRKRGLTQAQVAAEVGCGLSHYAIVEREQRLLRPKTAQRLARFYGVTAEELLP